MSKIIPILRLALDVTRRAKAGGELIWHYFKIEITPPMTVSLLNGPFGHNLGATATKVMTNIINGLDAKIKEIENQAVLAAKAKAAAIEAKLAKEREVARQAEEQKKKLAAEAAKKAAEQAKKVAESKAAASKAAAAKTSEAEKPADAKKAATPKAAATKVSVNKKEAEAKKSEVTKKDSGPTKDVKKPKK